MKKRSEKSPGVHNHKPQPFPDTKRKRKQTKPNKHKTYNRTCMASKDSDHTFSMARGCKRIGYRLDIIWQTARLVVNPIIVNGYASLFNCATAVRTSDSMTATSYNFNQWVGA